MNSKNMASTSESNASIYAGNAEKSADNALSSANTATAKAAEALSSANSIKNTETVVKGYVDEGISGASVKKRDDGIKGRGGVAQRQEGSARTAGRHIIQ